MMGRECAPVHWLTMLAVAAVASTACAGAPTGLLCDYKRSPAQGVRITAPHFSWIVQNNCNFSDHMQFAYALQVTTNNRTAVVWDSGQVVGADSTYAKYGGAPLQPGTAYEWTVKTWTRQSSDSAAERAPTALCESEISKPSVFITSLDDDSGYAWAKAKASFMSLGNTSATFAYYRKEIEVPAGVVGAQAFVTVPIGDPLLTGYKLYLNDDLINLGPGRGEAPVWDGDGSFRSLPYTTLDVTSSIQLAGDSSASRTVVIALETMAFKATANPEAIFVLRMQLANGAGVVTVASDGTWQGFNGDVHRKPTRPPGGSASHRHSAGTDFIEFIDARHEPIGWKTPGYLVNSSEWHAVTATAPTAVQLQALHARMEPPMETVSIHVKSIAPSTPLPPPPPPPLLHQTATLLAPSRSNGVAVIDGIKRLRNSHNGNSFLADFGREFQGGLRLNVADGTDGQTVRIICGEALGTVNGLDNQVTSAWDWEFTWTLRAGAQLIEQHKYMECRFVQLTFSGAAAPTTFTLSGWRTNYPYYPEDSSFTSSNATLNAVFELSRYTLEAASLDTYTDSNTRERHVYEADGIIAATSRLLIQRDVLWARHSTAYVIQFPTCPVEWMQITPFLAYQDYMWSGQPDLALAFADQIYERTMVRFVDNATGLINTSAIGGYNCTSGRPGMHIIDWMVSAKEADQTTLLGEYTESDHNSVDNMFAARGLEILATILSAPGAPAVASEGGAVGRDGRGGGGSDGSDGGGRVERARSGARNATQIAATAAVLKANIVKEMWNGTNYCNGVCSEVNGSSLLMANMFALAFGMVEQEHVAAAWNVVADWGLENIGDYGAFWYQLALSGNSVYAKQYEPPAADAGAAMLKALTKCDLDSWCAGIRDDNLTMTRESWHDGTYSHEWGASAIAGVTWGVMGLAQTGPSFATFTVKPNFASLAQAAMTVPTLRGMITINVTTIPEHVLAVAVPCNSMATLCMPRTTTTVSRGDSKKLDTSNGDVHAGCLLLDEVEVEGVWTGAGHLCTTEPVGCGVGGSHRVLKHAI